MVLESNDVIIRLLVITFLTTLIGLEREYHGKPAGLRTNVMVGIGSTLMTLASIKSLDLFPQVTALDPTRIAAQIVVGIGFIGAGAIMRFGTGHVVGLTTAATLWVVTGLGLAVGLGMYAEAFMATALVFFTFMVLSRAVDKIRRHTATHPPQLSHYDEDVLTGKETAREQ